MTEGANLATSIQNSHIEGNVIIKDNHVYIYASAEKKHVPLHEFLANSQHLPPALPHYYELHLAERDMRPREAKEDERIPHEVRRHLYLDPKRETECWYNPQPASQRLASISHTPNKAVHVILGEPGGGKTTLLTEWSHDAYRNYQANPRSAPFPIYMRLRELHNYEDKSQSKNETLQHYYQQRKTKFFDLMPFIQGKAKALWFFDGWDELPEEARMHWAEYIDDVAGQKIVSCRVLRYQQDFARFGTRQEYLIYGLNRQQQNEYLQKILPNLKKNPDHAHADNAWISTLLNKLHGQEHSNLRQLAISPLLLKLIAETNPPNAIKLPNTRSDFYDAAISNMLKRERRLEKLGRITERKLKKALAELAYHAGLDFNFPAAVLTDGLESLCGEDDTKAKQLEGDFINCGILRQVGDSYEFLHATFHEWELAHYLAQQDNPLVNAVQNYWRDPSYDEVIALLWTHNKVDDEQREEATYFLMEAGCQEQVRNTQRYRSGLKQSVVFWDLAGMQVPDYLARRVWGKIKQKLELRVALALIIKSNQSFFLFQLSKDKSFDVRSNLATNLNLPEKTMLYLAQDKDENVQWSLAQNPNISQLTIEKIINNLDGFLQMVLAENPNLPEPFMIQLAHSSFYRRRANLALNPSLPQLIMVQLAQDKEERVRYNLATNPNIPFKVMWQLSHDDNQRVRCKLAQNPYIPEEIMLELAQDKDEDVRFYLTTNPSIPKSIILQLTQDKSNLVKLGLGHNQSIEKLIIDEFQQIQHKETNTTLRIQPNFELVTNQNYFVRINLASNPEIPANLMLLLAKDKDVDVRSNLAGNPNISNKVMNQLLVDCHDNVRLSLASNPHISEQVMTELVKDDYADVPLVLAKNPNISEQVMLQLVTDKDRYVRSALASNPTISRNVILRLKNDEDSWVRSILAQNPNVCWEVFLPPPER